MGFDPENRITEPLVAMRADKVYLISHLRNNTQAAENLERARRALRRNLPNCTIETKLADVWDLFSCLAEYRRIFWNESTNHLYVNVSTGSKVVAIAGMLSCMLWGGSPYYARLDYSKPSPEQVVKIDNLPVYKINKPNDELLQVLSVVRGSGGKIFKKDLIRTLQKQKHKLIPSYGKDASASAPHSKLRTFLGPLEDEWKFVEIRARGRRSEVKLTEQGANALRIFGETANP